MEEATSPETQPYFQPNIYFFQQQRKTMDSSRINNTLLSSVLLIGTGIPFFVLLNLLLLGPIWLTLSFLRSLVIAASKVFVVGIGKPLWWKECVLIENYNERHRLSIPCPIVLSGDMSAERLQRIFSRDVLPARIEKESNSSSSHLRFPELAQFQWNFLGYRFWKDDPHFQIENHIKEVTFDESDTPDCFKSFEGMMEEFSGRPYRPRRSPWELWVVRKFPGEEEGGELRTVLLWRSHHSLMDGHSIVNVIINVLGRRTAVREVPTATALQLQRTPQSEATFLNMLSWALAFISGFYQLQFQGIQNMLTKRAIAKEWRRRRNPAGVSARDKVHFRRSPKLSLRRVKCAAAKLGLRVPSLLVAIASESLGEVLPPSVQSLNSLYAMPLPNHPGTACNHAYLGILQLPTTSCSTKEGLLSKARSLNETFLGLRTSPLSYVIDYMCCFVGHFPTAVATFIASRMTYVPVSISNFAVGNLEYTIGGLECLDMKGAVGPTRTSTDCVIVMVGFKSHIEIVVAANDTLFSEKDVERITAAIGDNFEQLMVEVEDGRY